VELPETQLHNLIITTTTTTTIIIHFPFQHHLLESNSVGLQSTAMKRSSPDVNFTNELLMMKGRGCNP